jgi:DNA-binding CsgD family transcriptional regulator
MTKPSDEPERRGWTGSPLTSREIEMVRLLAVGETPQEIARHLHLGEEQVRQDFEAIPPKLHAHTRWQAVVRARHLGLIEQPASRHQVGVRMRGRLWKGEHDLGTVTMANAEINMDAMQDGPLRKQLGPRIQAAVDAIGAMRGGYGDQNDVELFPPGTEEWFGAVMTMAIGAMEGLSFKIL